jgi:uncharacterized protein (TIGR03000 family)
MRCAALAKTGAILGPLLLVMGCGSTPDMPAQQTVHFRVLLPAEDAQLSINDAPTTKSGAVREFDSPPLEPGQDYPYTLKAYWMPNNYTMFSRTRQVTLRLGPPQTFDLREEDKNNPDRIFIRYVRTPSEIVDAMLQLAGVGKEDVVYDLGCGDGRIVIAAVEKFHARRGVGIDIDAQRIRESKASAHEHGVEDRVEFRRADVLQVQDLAAATVVTLYLSDELNLALRPILLKQLKPGARIVSHRFRMGDWKPLQTRVIGEEGNPDSLIHLWKIDDTNPKR